MSGLQSGAAIQNSESARATWSVRRMNLHNLCAAGGCRSIATLLAVRPRDRKCSGDTMVFQDVIAIRDFWSVEAAVQLPRLCFPLTEWDCEGRGAAAPVTAAGCADRAPVHRAKPQPVCRSDPQHPQRRASFASRFAAKSRAPGILSSRRRQNHRREQHCGAATASE